MFPFLFVWRGGDEEGMRVVGKSGNYASTVSRLVLGLSTYVSCSCPSPVASHTHGYTLGQPLQVTMYLREGKRCLQGQIMRQ